MDRNLIEQDVTLQRLASLLQEKDGPTLSVDKSLQNESIHLALKKRGSAGVMSDIAELLGYYWASVDQQRTLIQSMRAASHERALTRRLFAARLSTVTTLRKLLSLSEDQLRSVADRSDGGRSDDQPLQPFVLQQLLQADIRSIAEWLCSLNDGTTDALMSDFKYAHLSWTQLTAGQRQAALSLAIPPGENTRGDAQAATADLQLAGVLVSAGCNETSYPDAFFLRAGNRMHAIRTLRRGTQTIPGLGGASCRPYGATKSESDGSFKGSNIPSLKSLPFATDRFHEDYPTIWPEVFRQLGRALPLSLYSDAIPHMFAGQFGSPNAAFEQTEQPTLLRRGKVSIAEALDHLCAIHNRMWWRRGDSLFFRSLYWFKERESQLPLPQYATLQQAFSEHSGVGSEHLVALAALTRAQLRGIRRFALERAYRLSSNRGWGVVRRDEQYDYEGLRFFAGLSKQLQEQATSKEGLSIRDLAQADRQRYLTCLARCGVRPEDMRSARTFQVRFVTYVSTRKEECSLGLIEFHSTPLTRRTGYPFLCGTPIVFAKKVSS